jgi:fimbrial chaperone protein
LRKLACILLLLVSGTAVAAGISVSPTSLTLDARHVSASVTLTNGTDEEKIFQADPVSWRHEAGQDIYQPSSQLIVSPPMFRLAPGARQIVRVGLANTATANAAAEGTYRLFIAEVPRQTEQTNVSGAQLRLMLRLGLPLFVQPAAPRSEVLIWHARRAADGGINIQVSNNGNVHARLSELEVVPDGGAAPLRVGGFSYLFGGETRDWTLKPDKKWHGASVKFSVRTGEGVRSADLPLEGG